RVPQMLGHHGHRSETDRLWAAGDKMASKAIAKHSSAQTPGSKEALCRLCFYLGLDRKSTRLNSSHVKISYAVFCLKKKKKYTRRQNNTELDLAVHILSIFSMVDYRHMPLLFSRRRLAITAFYRIALPG